MMSRLFSLLKTAWRSGACIFGIGHSISSPSVIIRVLLHLQVIRTSSSSQSVFLKRATHYALKDDKNIHPYVIECKTNIIFTIDR